MTYHTQHDHRPIALVTGSAGTLGYAISVRLVSRGYFVILTDFDIETLGSLAKLPHSSIARLDVTDPEQWQALKNTITREYGELHCLVNCAGIVSIGEFTARDWSSEERVLDINLNGVFLGCQTMIDLLCSSRGPAHLINIASYAGFSGLPWAASYNASKAGVIALTETLYTELKNKDILVSVVCPGFFESNLFEHADVQDRILAATLRRVVTRSKITADQVADATVGLLDRYRLYLVVAGEARRTWLLKRWFPRWLLDQVAWRSHRLRAKLAAESTAADP